MLNELIAYTILVAGMWQLGGWLADTVIWIEWRLTQRPDDDDQPFGDIE